MGAEKTVRYRMVRRKANAKDAVKKRERRCTDYISCPSWNEVRRRIPEAFRKLEQKAKTSKKEWKWQRGNVTHTPSESQWNQGHFGSSRNINLEPPSRTFHGHVASDGSLLGVTRKWGACAPHFPVSSRELGPKHEMYGSMEAEFEVQRTIKRAELTAFLCLLKKVICPIKMHVDHKGFIDGLWRGEMKCIDLNAGDADLWIIVWEELHRLTSRDLLIEVEHVKAHRTKKDKKEMSHFEKFVSEGNEKAVELAKEGALLDEGFMARTRAKTVEQEREEVCAALQYAATCHCLEKRGNEASNVVVCCYQWVSMHEVKQIWVDGKATYGRT